MKSRGRYSAWVLTALVLLTTASCTGISVMSDYDRDYDFTRSRTYAWVSGADADSADVLAENPLVTRRVRSAVDRELAARGFRDAGRSTPDLLLVAHVYVTLKTAVRYMTHDPFYYGYTYRGRFFRYRPLLAPFYEMPVTESWREGRLIVDMIDERRKELVWRGSASGALKDYRTGEAMQKDIDIAVSKIFSDFPSTQTDARQAQGN